MGKFEIKLKRFIPSDIRGFCEYTNFGNPKSLDCDLVTLKTAILRSKIYSFAYNPKTADMERK